MTAKDPALLEDSETAKEFVMRVMPTYGRPNRGPCDECGAPVEHGILLPNGYLFCTACFYGR